MLEPDPVPTCRRDLAVLALVFGLLYFFQLGDSTLVDPDESRYAEIPREMIAHGDFVLPRLNGVFYFEKPPLVYWILAGFQKVLGGDEFAMRAVPALFVVHWLWRRKPALASMAAMAASVSVVLLALRPRFAGCGRVPRACGWSSGRRRPSSSTPIRPSVIICSRRAGRTTY